MEYNFRLSFSLNVLLIVHIKVCVNNYQYVLLLTDANNKRSWPCLNVNRMIIAVNPRFLIIKYINDDFGFKTLSDLAFSRNWYTSENEVCGKYCIFLLK